MGLSGAAETASFVVKTLLRPDSERVARQAVEALATLAAASALNAVHPGHAELFALRRLNLARGTLYGAADMTPEHCRGLLDRALP
jgi:putative acyl-CoA dehydrogenase